MRLVSLLIMLLAALLAAPPQSLGGPVCSSIGMTELADLTICASTSLSPEKGNDYSPRRAFDGDPATAWVEGTAGNGEGEWIELLFGAPVTFQTVEIANGYAKSRKAYADNGRIARARLEFQGGGGYELTLQDSLEPQTIRLPAAVTSGWVRLVILSVYPGGRWQDTCLNELGVDLEEFRDAPARQPELVTREEAAAIVEALTDVRLYMLHVLAEGRTPFMRQEDGDPCPACAGAPEDCCLCWVVGEDSGERALAWNRFCVGAESREVLVYDPAGDAWIPYFEWSAPQG
jgi:hypothetical protein